LERNDYPRSQHHKDSGRHRNEKIYGGCDAAKVCARFNGVPDQNCKQRRVQQPL
jgi:hypothetical protein